MTTAPERAIEQRDELGEPSDLYPGGHVGRPVLRYGGHIAVENLQDAMPAKGGIAMRAVVAALLFAFFGFMIWYGWLYTQRTMFQLTAATQIPFAYIYSAMMVGGVLLVIHFLLIVRGYVLRREFASDAHFDATASASL